MRGKWVKGVVGWGSGEVDGVSVNCGEVTDPRHSFESTRRGRRPANSFSVSVTAPAGAGLVYWATHHMNTT
ncbi:hypothetical protein DBP12_03780 [Streptomyces sp. CS014]|nr:hypothetical protein DBP12_03780 [Streptomyces sp. CS014]